jgi:hypothetical protein
MGIIFRLGVWLRRVRVIVSISLPKVMEYSSMAAQVYASWGICTDTYYGKKYSITTSSTNTLVHEV